MERSINRTSIKVLYFSIIFNDIFKFIVTEDWSKFTSINNLYFYNV